MPVGLEAWITQIPPVTRAWLALAVLTSLAVVRLIERDNVHALTESVAMSTYHAIATIFQLQFCVQ
jgi:hypothetical protein